jgi:4-hydroxy-2-oxoheptanedioate aldolase
MSTADFAARLRNRQPVLGYWSVIDSPVSTEWLAHIGWDYIALDLQHGLIGYDGMLRGLTAIDSAHGPAGIIRVETNDMTPIGRALDAGAAGVIVPLIDTADDAARAVSATRYPPAGVRSYGPMRSQLRIGPAPADANRDTTVIAMIENPPRPRKRRSHLRRNWTRRRLRRTLRPQARGRRCFTQRCVRRRPVRSGAHPNP